MASCLVFLSSVDVDDKTLRQNIARKANEVKNAIFADHPHAKLDSETRRFVATIAAIAVALGAEWAEWIDYAVAVTANTRNKKIPGAYLRNTLRKSLVEFAGICDTDSEAAAAMGKLLAAARPLAKPIFARATEEAAAVSDVKTAEAER